MTLLWGISPYLSRHSHILVLHSPSTLQLSSPLASSSLFLRLPPQSPPLPLQVWSLPSPLGQSTTNFVVFLVWNPRFRARFSRSRKGLLLGKHGGLCVDNGRVYNSSSIEVNLKFDLRVTDLFKMPRAHLNASVETPNVDVLVDLGHPLLNRVFDGFVKVGGVGALHAASQDTYRFLLQGIFVLVCLAWCCLYDACHLACW